MTRLAPARAARAGLWLLLAALVAAWPAAVAAQADAQAEEAGEAEEAAAADEEAAADQGPTIADEADPLRVLLNRVRATAAAEREEDRAREAEYRKARDEQKQQTLSTEARARREEALGQQLEATYNDNETLLAELDTRLTERIGQMGELFGVVRLVATDLSGDVYSSITSLGLENRVPALDKLGRNTGLPSTQDMEKLWYELLREMTAQGQIEARSLQVIVEQPEPENGGKPPPPVLEERRVVRAGPFVAVSGGEFLEWKDKHQTVALLDRQPPPAYTAGIEGFEAGGPGFLRLAVDPTQGALLDALTGTPSLLERINQGGYVGYTIILLGVIALALGLLRMGVLSLTGRKVAEQATRSSAAADNPLGRMMGVYTEYGDGDPELLELKLDEALLRESGGVERYLWVVQTISIIAPLLGLLGTVTGMIQTFQAITLFGAGDPKIMAGGISEALVTTTLGLVTAIPLVLLHSLLSSRARAILDVLEERRAAMIATRLEKLGVGL